MCQCLMIMVCASVACPWSTAPAQFVREAGAAARRLRVGTRIVLVDLQDDLRPTDEPFLGSINQLDAEQDFLPTRMFVQWLPIQYVGLEISWEHFGAETITWRNGHSDGTFDISGPTIGLLLRYPNRTRFTPFASVGVAMLDARFDITDWWHHGFSFGKMERYDAWVASGRPEWPNGGYQRTIAAEDTTGYAVSAGCEVAITEHVSLDFFIRYLDAVVDAHYYLSLYGEIDDDRGFKEFPMSNVGMGVGVGYTF